MIILIEMDGEMEIFEAVFFGGDHKGNMICLKRDIWNALYMNTDILENGLEIIGGLVLMICNGVFIDIYGGIVFDGGSDGCGDLPHAIS